MIANATRPAMRYGMIRSMRPDLDPDAAAYIAAVQAAGVTDAHLSAVGLPGWSVIRKSLNTFVLSEKAGNTWALWKRLYFPVWASAGANAIDLLTRTSGTFAGTVTHSAGYAKGNGNGKFTTVSPVSAGLTNSSGGLLAGILAPPSGTGIASHLGVSDIGKNVQLYTGGNQISAAVCPAATLTINLSRASHTGIFLSSRTSTTNISLFRRSASGFSTLGSLATSVSSQTVSANALFAMDQAGSGIPSDASYFAWGILAGTTEAQATALTARLKTLWETCTGLTLP